MSGRLLGSAGLAALLVLLLPRAGWCQCDLPVVRTEVVIEAQLLKLKLDQPARQEAARDAARELATAGSSYFPFFCWVQAAPGLLAAPAATLVLTAGDGARGGVGLRYSARIGRVQEDLSAGIGEEILYRVRHPGPDARSGQLQRDIVTKVQRQFANEDFRRKLKRLFIAEVPLSREARVQPVERILVPLDEARLKAGQETRLRIEVAPQAAEDGGYLVVKKEGRCRRGRKGMLTRLESLSVPSVPPGSSAWHPDIPAWLDGSRRNGRLVVYMEEPQWDACLSNPADGIVRSHGSTEPPACSLCSRRPP